MVTTILVTSIPEGLNNKNQVVVRSFDLINSSIFFLLFQRFISNSLLIASAKVLYCS